MNLRSLLEKMEIDFDAPVLYNPASASGPLENEPVVDDECYMGKDGQLDACADFGKCANPFHYLVLHFYIIYISHLNFHRVLLDRPSEGSSELTKTYGENR